MKILSLALLCGLTLSTSFVVNGDFEKPKLGKVMKKQTDSLPGWSGHAEIGKGSQWNKKWTSQVTKLDYLGNVKIQQAVQLPKAGIYVLKFEYAAQEQGVADMSRMRVFWNGKEVKSIVAEDYNIIKVQVIVNGKVGPNTLLFANRGKSKTIGITFDNVAVEKYVARTNFIVNGDFQTPNTAGTDGGFVVEEDIEGWTGIIEVGTGTIYNENWQSQVAELDADANTIISKDVNLPCKAKYILKYQYAARMSNQSQMHQLETSQMSVVWNGVQIDSVTPDSFELFDRTIEVQGSAGLNSLSFSGEGTSDSFGISIDNVELTLKSKYCY